MMQRLATFIRVGTRLIVQRFVSSSLRKKLQHNVSHTREWERDSHRQNPRGFANQTSLIFRTCTHGVYVHCGSEFVGLNLTFRTHHALDRWIDSWMEEELLPVVERVCSPKQLGK